VPALRHQHRRAGAGLGIVGQRSFADQLDEQIGGLAVSVAALPGTGDFAAALDEALDGLSLSVAVTPDASDFGGRP
jgi:hypothetical protein